MGCTALCCSRMVCPPTAGRYLLSSCSFPRPSEAYSRLHRDFTAVSPASLHLVGLLTTACALKDPISARRYERSVLGCSGPRGLRSLICRLAPLRLLLFTSTLFPSLLPSTVKMKFSAVLPALMTLPLLASAHFTLDYPTSRGFDEDIEPRASAGLTIPTSLGSDWLTASMQS